ncbi:bifunctional nuclease family protein [Microbacterium sp. CCNWLW134]|uniref:bifunctional nuclease family protein n=1 Tax=Microbacterium sp. CCNWLW134 TaxID=3122064 RepID=UPI00301055A4
MVQVRVIGVALDAARQYVILLRPITEEVDGPRMLPIWIGAQEATSIAIAVEGAEPPRPLAHDLMKTLLETVSAQVERVEITRIDDGTFYAEITLLLPGGRRVLDARPSDAIALASRVGAPIWVADEVLADAGIPVSAMEFEDDDRLEEEKLEEFKRFLDEVDPEDFQG